MTQSITVIAPLAGPQRRQRLARMIPFYQHKGWPVTFWGWERIRGEASQSEWRDGLIVEKTILVGGGHATRAARAMYPIWMVVVFFRVLLGGTCQTYHCLGWETAFPARLASTLTRSKVIFDDADRFSLVLGLKGYFNTLLVSLEKWTSHNCFIHIIPGYTRYDWVSERMFMLRNVPTQKDFKAGHDAAVANSSRVFTLYANGWLPETRGIRMITQAVDQLQSRDLPIRLIIAGRVPDPLLTELKVLDNQSILYLGEVNQVAAIAAYYESDLVMTFYDPAIQINREAESNKWGDCINVGVPFVVNSEVRTAIRFTSSNAAWSVPYGDSLKLANLVERLIQHPEQYKEVQKNLASFKKEFTLFDVQMEALLSRL